MQREPRMLLQPRTHIRLSVRPVVIHDQMQWRTLGKLPVQASQEAQKLLMPVLGHALPDYPSVQDIESGKECGGPVPLVVMGHRATASLLHRQARLSALEGLDLALLIHTEDDGLVRGIEIQSDYVSELLGKPRILGKLEPLGAVRLQSVGGPDALHRSLADALGLGHGARAPVGHTWRRALSGGLYDRFHPVSGVGHRSAPSRPDLSESSGTALLEPLAPEKDGGTGHTYLLSDAPIGLSIGGEKGDPDPPNHTLRGTLRTNPGFQRAALVLGHRKSIRWIPHAQ